MAMDVVSASSNVGTSGLVARAPSQAVAAPGKVSPSVSLPNEQQIRQAVRDIQRAVEPSAQNLQFSVDQESGKTVVRVVDEVTHEVIRQIPSEELIALSHALDRLAGLLVQEKA